MHPSSILQGGAARLGTPCCSFAGIGGQDSGCLGLSREVHQKGLHTFGTLCGASPASPLGRSPRHRLVRISILGSGSFSHSEYILLCWALRGAGKKQVSGTAHPSPCPGPDAACCEILGAIQIPQSTTAIGAQGAHCHLHWAILTHPGDGGIIPPFHR